MFKVTLLVIFGCGIDEVLLSFVLAPSFKKIQKQKQIKNWKIVSNYYNLEVGILTGSRVKTNHFVKIVDEVVQTYHGKTKRTLVNHGDDDLGNHTIPFKGNYNWSFCSRGDHRTLFYGYFWWGSKFQSLDLFNKELENHCSLNKAGRQHCYWWVRPDGFFVSPLNNTFSDFYWKFIKPWG
ncbi:putative plant self-incompatibility S1 [Helianthus annuus]|nr:putative plant self-incompatibility S1 [Helianthus annuus]